MSKTEDGPDRSQSPPSEADSVITGAEYVDDEWDIPDDFEDAVRLTHECTGCGTRFRVRADVWIGEFEADAGEERGEPELNVSTGGRCPDCDRSIVEEGDLAPAVSLPLSFFEGESGDDGGGDGRQYRGP